MNNDLQTLFDDMANADAEMRSKYHVTLGEMLQALGHLGDGQVVAITPDGREHGMCDPHSYRGYYSDLALTPTDTPTGSGELWVQLMAVLDNELTGYKGGEFTMTENTPLWLAAYGDDSSEALVRWELDQENGLLKFYTKNVSWS